MPHAAVAGFMTDAPRGSVSHRRALDVVQVQPFWPRDEPGHLHNLVYYRFTGPLRELVMAHHNGDSAKGNLLDFADALRKRAGGSTAMRQSLVIVCSLGAIKQVTGMLAPDKMRERFTEEVRSLDEAGAFVFTSDVAPMFTNPFNTDIGGTA